MSEFFFLKSPDFEAFQFSPFNLSFVHIKQAVMAEERLDVKLERIECANFFSLYGQNRCM